MRRGSIHKPSLLLDIGTSHEELELVVRQGTAGTPLFSFVSGSLVEGFGNSESDLDLYVVVDGNRGHAAIGSESMVAGKLRGIELTTLYVSDLIEIFSRGKKGFYSFCEITGYDILLMHRMLTGICITGKEKFEEFLAQFHEVHLNDLRADICIEESIDRYSDAIGSLSEGDVDTGLMNCREMIEQGFDSYLARHGETNPLGKWRLKRARRCLGEQNPVFLEFFKLVTSINTSSITTKLEHIQRCMRLHQYFHSAHCLFYLTPNAYSSVEELMFPSFQESSNIGINKSARSYLRNQGDKFFLVEGKPLHELDSKTSILWLAINGMRNKTELQVFCEKYLSMPVSMQFIERCLEYWKNKNLVSIV